MDRIIFHHDSVLSDVHMLLPNTRHLMTRLNRVGQPVFISKFKIISDAEQQDNNQDVSREEEDHKTEASPGEGEGEGNVESALDEDGDFDVLRRPRPTPAEGSGRDLVCPLILKQSHHGEEEEDEEEFSTADEVDRRFQNIIRIEHTMATPLEDVGKQVWRGAFLLADFILSEPSIFKGATVLELGAGTGLTSIVMATTARTVYCTDVGEDLLNMCKRNVTLNKHMVEAAGGEVKVRQLDWLQPDLCTDADVEFSWTEEEVADLHDGASFIVAADVCYDDDLTDALFRTLYRLCSNFLHSCTIFISMEKRMNFSLRHMDVSCEAYNHFSRCLSQLQDLEDGRCSYRVEQLPCSFPQFLQYERIDQLELWKVTATRARSDSELFPS
ncbi:methyltransferase-like protein 22 isoform 1-T2 [Aulostomus maculatus]